MFEDISTRLAGKPRKNILNSLLWLSAVTFPSGSATVAFGPWPGSLVVFVVSCIPVLSAIWYYRHWSNRDPDRLQTEGFNLENKAMTLLGVGEKQAAIEVQAGKLIDNPEKGELE